MAIFTESRGWSRAWSRGHVIIFTEVTRLFLNLHDVFLLQNRPLGASLATSKKNACSSLFEKWRKTGPEMSTMGAAFLGALQHDDLRNLAFLIWKLTIFAPLPASMLKFNEIPYWEMARPRPRLPSMLRPWPRGPRENDRPSGGCEHFWAVSQ